MAFLPFLTSFRVGLLLCFDLGSAFGVLRAPSIEVFEAWAELS